MILDLDELERLARAADARRAPDVEERWLWNDLGADQRFIDALSPAVVLALIGELRVRRAWDQEAAARFDELADGMSVPGWYERDLATRCPASVEQQHH